jgi:hypothetical protein
MLCGTLSGLHWLQCCCPAQANELGHADHKGSCALQSCIQSWVYHVQTCVVAGGHAVTWLLGGTSLPLQQCYSAAGHVASALLGAVCCQCCAVYVRRRLRAAEPGRAQGAGPGAQGLLHRAGVAEQPGTATMQVCPQHAACATLHTLAYGAGGPLHACSKSMSHMLAVMKNTS